MALWKVNSETPDHLELVDPEGWWMAVAKWDGCIDLHRVFNIPLPLRDDEAQLSDYIHLCDIDETIARLQELKKLATAHFQATSAEEFWPND